MIVRGVLVPPELADHVGRAIMQYLSRNGLAVPVLAVLQEEMLSVARSRKILAQRQANRTPSEASPDRVFRSDGVFLSAAEAGEIIGVRGRRVQQLARLGRIGRMHAGRWLFTREECEEYARHRRAGPVGGADAAAGGRSGP